MKKLKLKIIVGLMACVALFGLFCLASPSWHYPFTQKGKSFVIYEITRTDSHPRWGRDHYNERSVKVRGVSRVDTVVSSVSLLEGDTITYLGGSSEMLFVMNVRGDSYAFRLNGTGITTRYQKGIRAVRFLKRFNSGTMIRKGQPWRYLLQAVPVEEHSAFLESKAAYFLEIEKERADEKKRKEEEKKEKTRKKKESENELRKALE